MQLFPLHCIDFYKIKLLIPCFTRKSKTNEFCKYTFMFSVRKSQCTAPPGGVLGEGRECVCVS